METVGDSTEWPLAMAVAMGGACRGRLQPIREPEHREFARMVVRNRRKYA